MQDKDEADRRAYKIVVNHEEQYALWPADRKNALGWRDTGINGTKAECLARVEEVWRDMRPLSLREGGAAPQSPSRPTSPQPSPPLGGGEGG